MSLVQLKQRLISSGVVKIGNFKLSSGQTSNYYIDMRETISDPLLLSDISKCLYNNLQLDNEQHYICAVPYGAVPLASFISCEFKIPMIFLRKEIKQHGTGKIFEGNTYSQRECILVDDVITTGDSLRAAARTLAHEGIIVKRAIVVVDRRPIASDINLTICSLFNASDFLDTKTRLTNIITKKQTNICLSADMSNTSDILCLVQLIGPYICALKLHSDLIVDFDMAFIDTLLNLAHIHNFLIIEDRKFADIGAIVSRQLKGAHSIADWADIVTVHAIAGASTIQSLAETAPNLQMLIVAEMTTKDSLADENYCAHAFEIGTDAPNNVLGFVCRSSTPTGFFKFTTGINLDNTEDQHGQTYRNPCKIPSDVYIIGRAITSSGDPVKEIKKYLNICY